MKHVSAKFGREIIVVIETDSIILSMDHALVKIIGDRWFIVALLFYCLVIISVISLSFLHLYEHISLACVL